MGLHDQNYKLIFSHVEVMRDLLRGFLEQPPAEEIDLDTLEKYPGSFVTDDLQERHNDLIWRVRWKDQWVYVYLLLEFQSTIDWWMALRMMVYVGLLYQSIIKTEGLRKGDKLPPVVPIVLYNGDQAWDAPADVQDLIIEGPPGLAAFHPRLRHVVLDEKRYDDLELASYRNLVAAVFRLEIGRTPESIDAALRCLDEWLSEPDKESLLRDILEWVCRVLLTRRFPEAELAAVSDLKEARLMMTDRLDEWKQQWQREGEAAIVLRQLDRRFGPLGELTRAQVSAADPQTLMEWADRLLTANRLEEVIG